MAVGSRTIELTKIAAAALADKLGDEIVAIDLSEQLVLNQVFLLVTGSNEPQLQALSERYKENLLKLVRSQFVKREVAPGFSLITPI